MDKPEDKIYHDSEHSILWDKWFERNFIYCENTHSFAHRMFDKSKSWKTYHDAQNDAWKILAEMRSEFWESLLKADAIQAVELEKERERIRQSVEDKKNAETNQ